jgi:hypothetical protein
MIVYILFFISLNQIVQIQELQTSFDLLDPLESRYRLIVVFKSYL